MRIVLMLLVGIISLHAHSQKSTASIIDAEGVENILISGDEVFKITITTAPVETITLKTTSEGEYYNEISIEIEKTQKTLFLNSQFRKILQSGFDKLSAHKVFSMEIELVIPEGLSIEIESNLSSVLVVGTFEEILVQLYSGSCNLESFTGNAIVNTYNGNINVATDDAIISAISRHGLVTKPDIFNGRHQIDLYTINGDIRVEKTK